jgi:Fe-S-cluster containining protein
VFLSKDDIGSLTGALGINRAEFEALYCRWISAGSVEQLSLKEKSNYDCIFWQKDGAMMEGCSVYEYRPLQCRTFPFWQSVVASRDAWKQMAKDCPGMGMGTLHPLSEIEASLKEQQEKCIITRELLKRVNK